MVSRVSFNSERGTRKDSIPAQINNKALKVALNAGFGQMIRMKTSDENGLDGVIERGREHAQEISDTPSAIDTTSALAGERVSLGIESQPETSAYCDESKKGGRPKSSSSS